MAGPQLFPFTIYGGCLHTMHWSILRFNNICSLILEYQSEIKRCFYVGLIFISIVSIYPANASAKTTDSKTTEAAQSIVILGDSISAAYGVPTESGWVTLLANKLKQQDKPYIVINASISGETTSGGVKRLPDIIARHKPSILLIELGGNDGLRGFPLNVIKSNLQLMVDQAKANNITPILAAMRIPPNYGKRYTSGFYDIFKQTAEKNSITLIPFILEDVALNPELMQSDGIHPTELAQPLLLDRAWETLEPLL